MDIYELLTRVVEYLELVPVQIRGPIARKLIHDCRNAQQVLYSQEYIKNGGDL